MISLADLKTAVAQGDIDTVLVCMADMQGRLIGKRFQAEFFLDSAIHETHACDYLLANDIHMEPVPGYDAAGWEKGYGDFALVCDKETLRRLPWLAGTAAVLCDVRDHHGNDVPHAPRSILKRQIGRLAEKSWTAMMASELEFYLFSEDYRALRRRHYLNPKLSGDYIQDYHILQTSREEPVMRAIRNGLQGAGIPVENSKGEWGPGQAEINVRYADALTMADRHVIIKNAIKEISSLNGHAATFMAKWNTDLAGSSCHVHLSVQDRDSHAPLFHDPDAPHGMSRLMRQFLAGQIKYAADITLFLAPYINSYKRFQAATFAPTRTVWSLDNRTAGFRVCAAASPAVRIECRIGGADLNPYVAFAALIAAGLAGVEEGLEPSEPFSGDAYAADADNAGQALPASLPEAVAAAERSDMLRNALTGPVLEHYLHAARWEIQQHNRLVTDQERLCGFEQY